MEMDEIRRKIADCDVAIIKAIIERNRLAIEMGRIKKANGSQVRVPDAEDAVKNRYILGGIAHGISEKTLEDIATLLIEESVRVQENIINSDR